MENHNVEKIYNNLSPIINKMASSYAFNSGVDRVDLFSVGCLALVETIKAQTEPISGINLMILNNAKGAMSDLVRRSKYPVIIPSNIKKANALICKIKWLTGEDDVRKTIETNINIQIEELIVVLKNYAKGSSLSLNELIERSEYLPTSLDNGEETLSDIVDESKNDRDMLLYTVFNNVSDVEASVLRCILKGMTYEDISKEHNKSISWVSGIISEMRPKISGILSQ